MILITGGARSGKSDVAEKLATQLAGQQGDVLYIATSLVLDKETERRVAIHRQQRPNNWHTYEGYQNIAALIKQKSHYYRVIVLECVTTLLTNLLFDYAGEVDVEQMDFTLLETALNQDVTQLLASCKASHCEVIIVTNELGFGIVPENRLARHFRDIAGRVNQRLATQAETVYLVVSGIEIKIKG